MNSNYLHDNELFRQEDAEDTELAFLLHNGQSYDTDIIKRVVYRYSPILRQWISLLLSQSTKDPHDIKINLLILEKIFLKAFKHVDQFNGQASIENWLLMISYSFIKKGQHRVYLDIPRQDGLLPRATLAPSEISGDGIWNAIDNLPEKLIAPFILRYYFDKSLGEISHILNTNSKDVHNRLVKARQSLKLDLNGAHESHNIQAFKDGMLSDNQAELDRVKIHLAECDLCQKAAQDFIELEKTVAEGIKARWSFPPLDNLTLDRLYKSITNSLADDSNTGKKLFPVRKLAWIVGLLFVFLGLAIVFIRMTPIEREFPQAEPTITPELPA